MAHGIVDLTNIDPALPTTLYDEADIIDLSGTTLAQYVHDLLHKEYDEIPNAIVAKITARENHPEVSPLNWSMCVCELLADKVMRASMLCTAVQIGLLTFKRQYRAAQSANVEPELWQRRLAHVVELIKKISKEAITASIFQSKALALRHTYYMSVAHSEFVWLQQALSEPPVRRPLSELNQ